MKDNQTEKVFRIIGASNHSVEEREATDFYSTDPDCVKDLLELERFENKIFNNLLKRNAHTYVCIYSLHRKCA